MTMGEHTEQNLLYTFITLYAYTSRYDFLDLYLLCRPRFRDFSLINYHFKEQRVK